MAAYKKGGVNMKKFFAMLVVFCMVFSVAGIVLAADSSTENNPMTKIGRGLLGIADGVVEIPGTMIRTGEAEGAGAAFTKGLVEGIGNTVMRVAVGAYETVTFLIPVPENYAPILDEPKFLNKA